MSEIRSQATAARDELAETMVDDLFEAENCGELMTWDDNGTPWVNREAIAETLVPKGWSKPRTVNSVTELDALPELSVVLVGGQLAAQKDLAWFATGGEEPVEFNEEAWKAGIVVLFTPGDAG